ncbi:ketosteroid isomerase-like protein [Flavobacterium arsenatis]|uniref:Ketosteroid isomerase-like protein n=1 Tax=Flavobacterium arsenatis TaxID=1484332 RepID=A0ABU1TLW3_9FLAO|nr:nuclear transport factor 2 family protein [Flavobacterium arsenatis]MDR6966807.1 ketosteroid isomerase-like protein [Flavobacterium arsenatis]
MKRVFTFLFLILTFASCKTYQAAPADKKAIGKTLDDWHKAAAETQFDTYFSLMTDDAIFIGTDATENWNKEAFKNYSKPYFDKGKAWNFTSIQRNIFLSKDKKIAWFDELLDTQMKICRGSGVLKKENGKWKIAHYVLSITIPNDTADEVIQLKTKSDDTLIEKIKAKK